MPQTKKEKRVKAIAGYEKAIASWQRVLESAKTSPFSKTASARRVELAQQKITKLQQHAAFTRRAL
jgi:hypothetical protein